MDKIMLFEDFTKLYKRWSSGAKRKEDGTEVRTPYGTMLLKNKNCDYEGLIKMFLDDEGYISPSFCSVQNMGISREEISNLINDKSLYVYLLEDVKNGGLCIEYLDYDDAIEEYIDEDEYCEDDYIEICRCFAKYLRDNVDISHVKGKQADVYNLLLYSGDIPDEFDFDMFREDFENKFDTGIETWSFYYETNIGVEINYENVNRFKEMKDEVERYVNS